MLKSITADLTSPWGAAMLREVAEEFTKFLSAGLAGDGGRIGDWPRRVTALETEFGGHVLQIGDRDDIGRYGGVIRAPATYVRHLQQTLAALGFNVGTDGVFGPQTEAALRALQTAATQERIYARPLGPLGPAFRAAIRRYRGRSSQSHGCGDRRDGTALAPAGATAGELL